ncbi:superoxide dismutase family protein [Pelagicoccus sp. SDUM812002]|uniref:superoxide dismutase family protein n=1 Tax=Pelagicoccus sp. SDUM812002 TaxID=3041266 RepID=UPI00280CF6AF|nr:superoxide dismutase family protein [Pelagicoccus sp. SDUM812002]MDQ8186204.1 superoxide dismutase family protein [Pelagicoccus sp. SDUM812002]
MKHTNIFRNRLFAKGAAVLAALGVLLSAGCSNQVVEPDPDAASSTEPLRIAEARLSPTQGNNVEGVVTFVEEADGIRVFADIRNLSTSGRHGFHVHENGDCSAPDGTSAGGHFNPTNEPHAGPMADKRHVGDLGNLDSTDTGDATLERVDEYLSFDGEKSIIGKAVIIHAGADDFESQPSGAAGPRIACGVIEWVQQNAPQ